MKGLQNIEQIYFLGIGGIGMSALARWFNHAGYCVSGYDLTNTILTATLQEEGISIHYDCRLDLVQNFNKEQTLVVYTPAIPASMEEYVYLKENGFRILKRAEVLGEIAGVGNCLAVAGTHGKTSISTMVSHLLSSSSVGCSAFLGGISKNYQTNLLLSDNSDVLVCEADEFDRSFLHLLPNCALISSADADHLDIYKDVNDLLETFNAFAKQVSSTLIVKQTLPRSILKGVKASVKTYSLDDENANFYAKNICLDGEAYRFDFCYGEECIKNIRMTYPGRLNVENMVGAIALALQAGMQPYDVINAVSSYKGVERRFDIRYRSHSQVLIDDYAHHPEELRLTIKSVREMFSGRRIVGVFQPHLFSRTRDFVNGFAKELGKLDKLYLMDIYPAREFPIEGVNSQMLLDKVKLNEKCLLPPEDILQSLLKEENAVILMMGAGNISNLVNSLAARLSKGGDYA